MDNWKKVLKQCLVFVLMISLSINTEIAVLAAESEESINEEAVSEEIFYDESIDDTLVIEEFDTTEISVEENVSTEYVDLGGIELNATDENIFFSASTGEIDLKGGNYEKWVNRINLPSYALSLYNQLSEGSDNDGYKDILIDDAAFQKANAKTVNYTVGKDTFYAIKITTLNNPTSNQRNYVYKAMRVAYDAYLMDHPEVFWLSGDSVGYSVISNGTYTFYFIIKMHSGSYSDAFDIRSDSYISASAIKSGITTRDKAVNAILNTADVKYAENDYETITAFNRWLTENNEYNTRLSSGTGDEGAAAHQCLSALVGNEGVNGPVCEGYAKAFKVLCDKKNIACVLTVGNAGGAHMWNSVRVNGIWYETDVTWNDPSISGGAGALSGSENEDYLLVGTDTIIDSSEFDESHTTTNKVSKNGVNITNGPIISPERYIHESESDYTPTVDSVYRIAGEDRYETSLDIAYVFQEFSDQEAFHSVIIANGKNFADALSGSYLAAKTNAPILMTNGNNKAALKNFISENLIEGGTIYILGGTAAVSAYVEVAVYGLGTIERLAGSDRYATNLEILKEAGVNNQEILVCTGKGFADSLSASASGKPLLLINNKSLSTAQKTFLAKNSSNILYVIGGTTAVSTTIEKQLKTYGTTIRIGGANRYETSVLIAEEFFSYPSTAVIASAKKFPDGLCGGPLAMALNAPLILTADGKETVATEYMYENDIQTGLVLGGESVISDDTALTVFGYATE